MDLQEAYRTLELQIGATRAEVDAAYVRLVEKWHPDRAANQGHDAVRESQRQVQIVNEAYKLLAAIAPGAPVSSGAAAPAAARAKPAAAPAADTPRAPISKPKIAPLSTAQPDLNRPPPPKPPSGAWEARAAAPPGAPPPPAAPPPPPSAAPAAPAQAAAAAAVPPAPAASAPTSRPAPPPAPPAPAPAAPAATRPSPPPPTTTQPPAAAAAESKPSAAKPRRPVAEPAPDRGFVAKAVILYDMLFPEDSPRRRHGPYIVAGAILFILLLGKCAFSSSHSSASRPPDPNKTGRLIVKSNLAGASIAARRMPFSKDPADGFAGTVGQPIEGMPPGKYAVMASAAGWPAVHAEAELVATQATNLEMNFNGGALKLDTDPTGAAVHMGETDLGRTPLTIPLLPPGDCEVLIEYPSLPALSFKATITEGETAAATVRLPHGRLVVESTPTGATVLLGNKPLGVTPLTLAYFPPGVRKLAFQAKGFPTSELAVTVNDGADVTVHPALATAFPLLDPAALFHSVWVPDNPDAIAPPFDGLSGPSAPRNGVIRNLNRKILYNDWLTKTYRVSGTVKGFDRAAGTIEFADQQTDLCRYHMIAKLSVTARADAGVVARLTKGATFSFYGQLTAAEEARWVSKSILLEFVNVEPMP